LNELFARPYVVRRRLNSAVGNAAEAHLLKYVAGQSNRPFGLHDAMGDAWTGMRVRRAVEGVMIGTPLALEHFIPPVFIQVVRLPRFSKDQTPFTAGRFIPCEALSRV
jgi:hypothetical protein